MIGRVSCTIVRLQLPLKLFFLDQICMTRHLRSLNLAVMIHDYSFVQLGAIGFSLLNYVNE